MANPIADVLNYFTDSNGNPATVVGGAAHSVIVCTLPIVPTSTGTAAPAKKPGTQRELCKVGGEGEFERLIVDEKVPRFFAPVRNDFMSISLRKLLNADAVVTVEPSFGNPQELSLTQTKKDPTWMAGGVSKFGKTPIMR